MRRCQANLPNRCRRQIDRIARRAFDGEQWMDREGRAATTGNTYCGNLLWQSGLTLLAPVYGEVTETVVEIAITLGGATLRHVAKHTARGAIEGGARQAYRRRHNLIGKGGFVHHVNPIKGHPNGKGAMFPLPFRWAARTDLNMKWYATKAEHLAAHKRLMFEDDLERFRILTTLPRATINACVQHLNNEVGEGCWDSLEVNGEVNIYDSNVNVNAVPESISFSLIEGAW